MRHAKVAQAVVIVFGFSALRVGAMLFRAADELFAASVAGEVLAVGAIAVLVKTVNADQAAAAIGIIAVLALGEFGMKSRPVALGAVRHNILRAHVAQAFVGKEIGDAFVA